MNRVSD